MRFQKVKLAVEIGAFDRLDRGTAPMVVGTAKEDLLRTVQLATANPDRSSVGRVSDPGNLCRVSRVAANVLAAHHVDGTVTQSTAQETFMYRDLTDLGGGTGLSKPNLRERQRHAPESCESVSSGGREGLRRGASGRARRRPG